MAAEGGQAGLNPFLHNPYKVAIPAEKRQPILQDLVAAYQAKFGDAWRENLIKNLRPSPLAEIAAQHGVSVAVVRSLKYTLWLLGMLVTATEAAGAETSSLSYAEEQGQ
jgi:hypothetical protein